MTDDPREKTGFDKAYEEYWLSRLHGGGNWTPRVAADFGREYGQREAREDLETARHDALMEHARVGDLQRDVLAVAEEMRATEGETFDQRSRDPDRVSRWADRLTKIARGEGS